VRVLIDGLNLVKHDKSVGLFVVDSVNGLGWVGEVDQRVVENEVLTGSTDLCSRQDECVSINTREVGVVRKIA
jgi:hypothetical protein